ncbi:MAG: hypothetical protein LBC79_09200 [Deltaproteobacteria bacterium]|jgi:hypothetical protein|nr:hypothetical protein [Deltaproteobacteria bacterium]
MRLVYHTTLLAGLVLAGCSSRTPPLEPEPLPPLVAFLSSAPPAASAQLDDPAFGNAVLVTQEEAFVSASGEECRRATVVAREREAEMVVVCRTEEGQAWRMMPRIMGSARP